MTSANQSPMLKHDPADYYSGNAVQAAEAIRDHDHLKLGRILIQSPAVARNRGKKDLPLLAWAMGHNDPASFKLLLQAGANPNDYLVVQDGKMSLISVATGAENSQWLDLLLQHKANPNGLPDTEPPLFTARFAHKPDRFERLLKAGADLNHPDETGKTVIISCVMANDYIGALKLVKCGADPNVKMKNGTTVRKIIERFPLPPNTPQGDAQVELTRLLEP